MRVHLIGYTMPTFKEEITAEDKRDISSVCGEAAAICTGYAGDPLHALDGAMASGHESVAEHASFTFRVEGVSRVLLAQLTRHRLASFSVQSQRYCRLNNPEFIEPETIAKNNKYKDWPDAYNKAIQTAFDAYASMIREGIPEEDARYVLPQAVCCDLIVTMNARELRHFFELRCCNRAQWEIRELADRMLAAVRNVDDHLFKNAGAPCQMGKKCPEKRPCGHPRKGEQ